MKRRDFLKGAGAVVSAIAVPGCLTTELKKSFKSVESKPNFVFFLVDDLGWADVGCYGSKFYDTPNIDKLASEGMMFTDAYAACPVCSPTRASIMSGKYPARLNLTNFDGHAGPVKKLKPPKPTGDMPLEEFTIAEALKEDGYTTYFAGKWHIGHDEQFYPQHQGFDINIAGHGYGQPGSYYYPYKHPIHTWSNVPGLEDGKPGEYLTDRLTDESVKFLDSVGDKAFLLYHSFYSVHTPIEPRKDLAEKYRSKMGKMPETKGAEYLTENGRKVLQVQNNPDYAAMVAAVDQSVGRILSKLEEHGLTKNTAVIFTSDNGGLFQVTSNLPLRAGKGWLYEGGIREPLIIKWPGVVKDGSLCREPVTSTDFYPTMLEMAALSLRPKQHIDGESLMPLLNSNRNGKLNRKAIFWHYPHYHSLGNTPAGAVRCGDYKLIENYEDFSVELYNLKDDIGETKNLSEQMPEKANKLRSLLHNWRKATGARMPAVNPDYRPKDNVVSNVTKYKPGNPALPNVLIIGDSISIGYTPFVKEYLAGKANVYRIPTNAQHTVSGLKNLDRWLGNIKWDVIYFNWGLHDLCYRNPKSSNQGNRDKVNGKLTTSLDRYDKNLRQLVERLKKTGAGLVWATTTPVPDNELGRFKGDEIKYNAAARRIMVAADVTISDLYSHAMKKLNSIQIPGGNVHFHQDGSRYIAQKVTKSILTELGK